MENQIYNRLLKQKDEAQKRLNKLNNTEPLQERAIRYNQGVVVGLDIALEIVANNK